MCLYYISAEKITKVDIPKNLNEEEFIEFLKGVYPKLRETPFDLCKVNRHRVVVELTERTPREIRDSGVLGRSALYFGPRVSRKHLLINYFM